MKILRYIIGGHKREDVVHLEPQDKVKMSKEKKRDFIVQIFNKKQAKRALDDYLDWKYYVLQQKMLNAEDEEEMMIARDRLRFIEEIKRDANGFAIELAADDAERERLKDQEMQEKKQFKVFGSPEDIVE